MYQQGMCNKSRRISNSNTTTYVRVYASALQASQCPSSSTSSLPPSSCSPCEAAPCSHLCLLSPPPQAAERLFSSTATAVSAAPQPAVYQCSCPIGTTLQSDGHACNDGPEQFLLLASPDGLFRVSLDTTDYILQPLDPSGRDTETQHYANDVEYDPVEREIYWVDIVVRYYIIYEKVNIIYEKGNIIYEKSNIHEKK